MRSWFSTRWIGSVHTALPFLNQPNYVGGMGRLALAQQSQ